MGTAWDIPIDTFDRGDGHLPSDKIYEWATQQAILSELYADGKISGTSGSGTGRARKRDMLCRIHSTLIRHRDPETINISMRMRQLEEHLEDPGLLENFEYFDVPSSDFMLQFYFAMWDRRIAELMGYVHNFAKDLYGVMRPVPKDDIWYHMSHFEGMNINERKKAKSIADFIRLHSIRRATSFGGGDIPERLYGLPKGLSLTVFDNGPVRPVEELFDSNRKVHYFHEPLSAAMQHRELHGTQELVWMHGLTMYLDEENKRETTGAILCGAQLLEPGGYMKYDYLMWTESIRRVIRTQCWPYDPAHPMVIFRSVDEAIFTGRETLEEVNRRLGGKAYMDASDPELTLVEPWGVTSVRFTVQKHC